MNFIERIKEKNQFPILFIGSGIIQRYFKNAPTWEELLINLWSHVYERNKYFLRAKELKDSGYDKFKICLLIADELEKAIDTAFYEERLMINNLEIEQAYRGEISPFRQLIANTFSTLERRDNVDDEIKSFAKMIIKARFIITTNYDCFIEDCYRSKNTEIKVNIGNAGLFKRTASYGELYKIHGSMRESNSITITSNDYEKNEARLALVNAKILTNLVESPILFFGYSMTDENIQSLVRTYSENLPLGATDAATRIGVIVYERGREDIFERFAVKHDLKLSYTELLTDNYKGIYEQIAEINQGYLPSEIAKYEGAFRKIIEVKGPQSGLNTILTSFEDLSKLSDKQISGKNIVVAFGDSKHIYRMPNYADYIREYFSENGEMPIEVVLNFVRVQTLHTPIPIKKYISSFEKTSGFSTEKLIVSKRVAKYENYVQEVKNLKISKKDIPEMEKAKTPAEVYHLLDIMERNKLNFIVSRIDLFQLEDVRSFVFWILKNKSDSMISNTEFRRLFMVYSMLV